MHQRDAPVNTLCVLFCGFDKVPDASKITRFKQAFLDDLQSVFDILVDLTEPVCQAIDSSKADMTIFDSSGIEAFVTENNPKYANRIIRQLKAYATSIGFDENYNPYAAAYKSMSSHASANPEIKQLFVNGHFCYVFKFGIVTNSLGIIRHISFYNRDFMTSHPDIVVHKKSDSPDEDKCAHDSKLLIPTLMDFFRRHPLINPKVFLGDAAFDALPVYSDLLTGDTFGAHKHFSCAYIPLNKRSLLADAEAFINENGIPCCPRDSSLLLKKEGNNTAFLRNGLARQKFICPMTTWDKYDDGKYRRVCHCENPCTSSASGRMVYVYPEKNLRAYP